jgi:hypothetical protein
VHLNKQVQDDSKNSKSNLIKQYVTLPSQAPAVHATAGNMPVNKV